MEQIRRSVAAETTGTAASTTTDTMTDAQQGERDV